MKLVITTRKPRNPLVAPALLRHAGRHEQFRGARRQADRHELRRELQQLVYRKHSP